jgi:undecaprenyl-diphosphatase
MRARIGRWDRRLLGAVAGAELPPALDRGLPLLTRAADHSKLWLGLAALMAGTGRKPLRRGAVRGVASIAATSLVANQMGKRLLARRRPDLSLIPVRRVAHRVPGSNSFPSGHSASAAAFAVAVAAEAPVLALPVGLLAAAVAFSRVYTGVHYPSDVLAGAALGAALAGAGVALVPGHAGDVDRPGCEPARLQPPRPTGRGVVAVVNPGSGSAEDLAGELRALLPDAEIVELAEGDDLAKVFAEAASRAEVLGVAGGDGTINCAAAAALDADVPLLVVPAGTFNHFARDIGLEDVADAVAALADGRAVRIDVAEAAGRPFLNTASVGSYPEFVATRERWEQRLGKPLAAVLAMTHVARSCPPLEVQIDGEPHELVMFFVGNGAYEPRGFVPLARRRLDSGVLDVRLLDARRGGRLSRVALAALRADFRGSSGYVERRVETLTVRSAGGALPLATDGEVREVAGEVRFTVRRQALTVYRGAPAQ